VLTQTLFSFEIYQSDLSAHRLNLSAFGSRIPLIGGWEDGLGIVVFWVVSHDWRDPLRVEDKDWPRYGVFDFIDVE